MLKALIAKIQPLDQAAMDGCQLRLDNLTKPLNSLFGLERLVRKLAGITRQARPRGLGKTIILMAADHGVACEGVSAYPQAVTSQMVANFCAGCAAINSFAQHADAKLVLVDIGVAADLSHLGDLRQEKIAYGTYNMLNRPAMTTEQTMAAIQVGIKVVQEQLALGVQVVGLGEMGIGNTTASTAIISCYSTCPMGELTGRGTGITQEQLARKVKVIEQSLATNNPDHRDPFDVLAKVGGLEIAGLVGVILGAAAGGAAVVLDGLITSAAALIAVKMAPQVQDYLIGSHLSPEPAHKIALELIEVPAYLHLRMRQGEGSGAALGMSLIQASLDMLNEMKTFGEAEVAIAQDGPGAARQQAGEGCPVG